MAGLKTTLKFETKFDACKNDIERWKLVYKNRKKDIRVYLDNDDTFVTIGISSWQGRFNDYLGSSSGIAIMLDALGIDNLYA